MEVCRILGTIGLVIVAIAACIHPSIAQDDPVIEAARAAETELKARVGVAIIDSASNRTWLYHADERFAMASTSKAVTCAALLAKGEEVLRKQVLIRESDILDYAPVTKSMVGRSIEASDLCAIALRTSDNTAINKVLDVLGGPQSVTGFVRSIGDETTRLDRNEPSLNEARPNDPRDTTTPRSMAATLSKLLLGSALNERARNQLTNWLVSNEVGGPLLRAGIPADWRIADRTGAGGFGTRGAIAVMWPSNRAPIVAAVYLTETEASMEKRNAAIAAIAKAVATIVTSEHRIAK